MPPDERKIPLRVSNHKAYVWDVDDLATLRSKHRICGILSGTLPHLSQQNVFLGIPLILMPEEAVLLVENELAVLVDDVQAHPDPQFEQIKQWHDEQQEDIKRQLALQGGKGKKETSDRAITPEALRKRQAREEKRLTMAKLAQSDVNALEPDTLMVPHGSPNLTSDLPEAHTSFAGHTIVIPASSPAPLNWYRPDACTYTTISAAKGAGIWNYPSTPQERAKCGVFRSLWEQGYFMGGGIKFGGDYLVYPGDPLRYHSHFAATVLDSPLSSLRPMEVVAHGRLGTATKKGHLLCSWDDEKKEVSFMTIEWAGFG